MKFDLCVVYPTFSIIIPVYNVAPYLRECLDSVLAQTYTDWDVLVVTETKFQHSFLVGNSWGRCPQIPGVFKALRRTA